MMRGYHTVYKAFRVRNGRLCFLFRGHKGSLEVPIGEWLTAKMRLVRDGKGRRYRAGFHFMWDEESVTKFDKRTKNKYVILKVDVRERVRPKPNSPNGVWLAQQMRVLFCSIAGCSST